MLLFLADPIERIVYTNSLPDEVFCVSEVDALSGYSMPSKERDDTYAIAKEEARRLQIRTNKKYGETRIEIRRCNPCFFSENGVVDKLSLFLAMKGMDDKHIQIELEIMINSMIWQEELINSGSFSPDMKETMSL